MTSFKLLIALTLFTLLPFIAHAQNQVVKAGTHTFTVVEGVISVRFPAVTKANLPTNPVAGDIVIMTDGDTTGDCQTGGGSNRVLCEYDGTAWNPPGAGGSGGSQTFQQVVTEGAEVTSAISAATCVKIGDGTRTLCIYGDASDGLVMLVDPAQDAVTRISADKNLEIQDAEDANKVMERIDPDAASVNLKWVYDASEYRPLRTAYLGADMLYVIGVATLTTNTALISGGEVAPYITVTDADTDGFQRSFRMPGSYDGGTVTVTISLLSVNATPSDNFEVDISGECWGNSDVRSTIDTTGEVAANFDFDASGTCGGSACVTDEVLMVTTTAITLNGTPAAGDICGFQALVDATATSDTVNIADIKITDMNVHFSQDSRSD